MPPAAILVLASLAGTPNATLPVSDAALSARQEYAAGARDFAGGRYLEAIDRFRAADRLRPSANLSYDIARCYEQLGDLRSARRSYLEYLRRAPDASDRDAAQAAIAAIDARLTLGDVTSAPGGRAGQGGPAAARPASLAGLSGEPGAPQAAPPAEARARSHVLAWSLFGAGAAALLAGGTLNVLAAQEVSSPDALVQPAGLVAAQNPRAQGLFTAAVICYAAGAALGIAGALDYWLSG